MLIKSVHALFGGHSFYGSCAIIGFAIYGLLAAHTVSASDGGNTRADNTGRVEIVEVEAEKVAARELTRSDFSFEDYPQSIHVVERDMMDNQLAIDLTDIVRNVSGIQGKATYDVMGQGLSGDYLIRGLWSESYVNGRQTFLNIGLDPATLINIEHVEVLKGTAATLFTGGYGAPNGGVINLSEKRPLDKAATTVGVTAGSYGTWGIDIDMNQPLSEVWRFRLTADKTDRGINIDDIKQDVVALYPTLLADFEKTDVIIRSRYQKLKYDYYHGLIGATHSVLDDENIIIGTLIPAFTNVARDRIPTSEAESFGFDISVNHQFSQQLHGAIRAGYNDAEDFNHYVAALFGSVTGSLRQDADITDISADLQYKSEGRYWSSVSSLIVDYSDTDIEFIDTFATFVTPLQGSYTTANVGVQQELTFVDRLRLIAGMTHSAMELEYRVAGIDDRGIDESEMNWKIGLSYDISQHLTPYASANEGSRLPSPTVIASSFFSGEPELEVTRQVEAGVRFNFERLGISGSIVVFENDLENAADSIGFTPLQLDKSSEGWDLDMRWHITPSWRLALNYTHLDAGIAESGSPYEGNKPFNLPENFGRIYGQYLVNESWVVGLGISLGDERAGGLDNAYFTEEYALVDVQISLVRPSYSIRFGIDNLLDEDHYEPVLFFGGGYFDQTQPRTFTIRTAYTF